MTFEEWEPTVRRISALWNWEPPADWISATFDALKDLDGRDVASAVKDLVRGGVKYPPKAPELYSAARQAQARRRSREEAAGDALPSPKGITLEEYAAAHNGYSPAQMVALLSGREPGPPRFPESHDPDSTPPEILERDAQVLGLPVSAYASGETRPERGGASAAHPDPF